MFSIKLFIFFPAAHTTFLSFQSINEVLSFNLSLFFRFTMILFYLYYAHFNRPLIVPLTSQRATICHVFYLLCLSCQSLSLQNCTKLSLGIWHSNNSAEISGLPQSLYKTIRYKSLSWIKFGAVGLYHHDSVVWSAPTTLLAFPVCTRWSMFLGIVSNWISYLCLFAPVITCAPRRLCTSLFYYLFVYLFTLNAKWKHAPENSHYSSALCLI